MKKSEIIINILEERVTKCSSKEDIQMEIFNAAKAAFIAEIGYFDFAEIEYTAKFNSNERKEILARKVKELVSKMEDEAFARKVAENNNSKNGNENISNRRYQENLQFQEQHLYIHLTQNF